MEKFHFRGKFYINIWPCANVKGTGAARRPSQAYHIGSYGNLFQNITFFEVLPFTMM